MIRYYGQENTPGAPGNFLANQGPSTPVKFDERMNQLVPTLGGGGIKKDSVRWKNTPTEFPQAFGMFPGMQVAGSPGYMLDRDIIEQRMDRYDMQQRGLENFRFKGVPGSPAPVQSPPRGPQLFPLAQSAPGTVPMGNAAGIANAEFYRGPQYGQMPVGFAGKTVS